MMAIGDVLVSEEVVEKRFACELSKCKGACCVAGDVGAPLEKEELPILDEIYEDVAPYLTTAGRRAIADQGTSVYDFTGDYSTPLVDGRECAYTTFTPEGVALCGIEQAYRDGKTDFQKPISCHLYPIRVAKTRQLEALNYDQWDICSPACSHGQAGNIRIYEFVKQALIRKYGQEFYDTLDQMVKQQENRE
ncbi:MAG: DUF3109 family protein [Bacteroidetes bacterium]|nr:MAG: DUF3109 family protein [Bacteroidota bacterium]